MGEKLGMRGVSGVGGDSTSEEVGERGRKGCGREEVWGK